MGNGASSAAIFAALPQCRGELKDADLALLETFARASDAERKELLSKFSPGTPQHGEILAAVSEQLGYPKDLEDILAAKIKEYTKDNDEDYMPDWLKRYLFRKRMTTLNPVVPTLPTSDEEKKARPEEAKLLAALKSAIGPSLHDSKPYVPPRPASGGAGAGADDDRGGDESSGVAVEGGCGSSTPAEAPQSWIDVKAIPTAARIAGYIAEANEAIKKYPDALPRWMGSLRTDTYAHEHPLAAKEAASSDRAAWAYLNDTEQSLSLLPDVEDLPALVRKALGGKYVEDNVSKGSAAARTFPHMTLAQLREAKGWFSSWPEEVETLWLREIIARLAPAANVDLRVDMAALSAYCDAVWAVLAKTSAAKSSANEMRAIVAFNRLRLAYSSGGAHSWTSDAARDALVEFLKIPLSGVPWERDGEGGFLSGISAGIAMRNAGSVYSLKGSTESAMALPGPSPDEVISTVTAALTDILGADAAAKPVSKAGGTGHSLSPWDKYCSARWLTTLQAKAQILAGRDPEAWSAKVHVDLEGLRGETYLRFAPGNSEWFTPSADVSVSFEVKGVQRVSVRLFELSTTAYYGETGAEIPSDIKLEGLLPFHQQEVDVTAVGGGGAWSPFRSSRVKLPLSALSAATAPGAPRRGVFVVEIAGGTSACRAVIRKGALRVVERRTVAGHALTVLDENNAPLPAELVLLRLNGRVYRPNPTAAAGAGAGAGGALPGAPVILIPYAARGGRYPMTVTLESGGDDGWSFSTLLPSWEHCAESYTLEAAFALEREALVKDNYSATMLVRARLLLHGSIPAPIGTLVNTTLQLTSVDADGNSSSRVIRPFTLASDTEGTVTFAVPPGLRRLTARLTGDYEVMADGSRVSLSAQHEVSLNGIESGDETRALFLRRLSDGTWALYLLGKTGEPVPGVSLPIALQHSQLRKDFTCSLTTDAHGGVYLGPLHAHGYTSVSVSGYPASADGRRSGSAAFELPQDTATFPSVIHTSTLGDGGAFFGGDKGSGGAGAGSSRSGRSARGGSGPWALQGALPFRPPVMDDADKPVRAFKLSRRDVRLVEVRPRPAGARSAQLGGSGGGGDVTVADMLGDGGSGEACPYLTWDASLGMLLLHDLPAGEYALTIKRPYPSASQPSPTIRVRVLPAPATDGSDASGPAAGGAGAASARAAPAASSSGPARLVNGFLASGCEALQVNALPAGGDSPAGAIMPACPVQIASITVEEGAPGSGESPTLVVRVCGGSSGPGPATGRDVRVHITASYFAPAWETGAALARGLSLAGLAAASFGGVRSRYLAAAALSEELKYVADRQIALRSDAPPLPGNLLPRPSLLLNPWSLGPAASDVQTAKDGGDFARHTDGAGSRAMLAQAVAGGRAAQANASSYATRPCLDFLVRPALLLPNCALTAGELRIPLSKLALASSGDGVPAHWDLHLTCVAVDAGTQAATHTSLSLSHAAAAVRMAALAEGKAIAAGNAAVFRDLSAGASTVPLAAHVVQTRSVRVLAAGDAPIDITTGGSFVRVEAFASLDRMSALLVELSKNKSGGVASTMASEWGWLLRWPALPEAEKRSRYSKYACAELHLFLFFKDQPFWRAVVRPFLACKRAKSFVDRWLLGEDVSSFASPAAFSQLNAFEKALLAARIGADANPAEIARRLAEQVELSPTTPSDREAIFKAALASDGLSAAPPPVPVQQSHEQKDKDRPMSTRDTSEHRAMPSKAMAFGGPPPPCPPPPGGFAMPCPAPSMAAPCAAPAPSFARSSRAQAAPAPMMKRRMVAQERELAPPEAEEEADMAFDECAPECEDDADGYGALESALSMQDGADMELRAAVRASGGAYRPLDKTEEYAEAHYWRVREPAAGGDFARSSNGAQSAPSDGQLVQTNEFWVDFAAYSAALGAGVAAAAGAGGEEAMAALAAAAAAKPFVSANIGSVVAPLSDYYTPFTINRILLALAVTGLPMDASPTAPPARPAVAALAGGGIIRYTSGGTPLVLYFESMTPASSPGAASILVGQQFFDPSSRSEVIRGVSRDKFIPSNATVPPTTGGLRAAAGAPRLPAVEMLSGRVYGCCVTVTNVSSESAQLEVLLSIPRGALPASNGFFSRTELVDLPPFSTRRLDGIRFYFPRTGPFAQYPVHVGAAGELVAHAAPQFIAVVRRLAPPPAGSEDWSVISAEGSMEQVLGYLRAPGTNLYSTDITRILWRCKKREDWAAILAVLRERAHYSDRVWGYAFEHGDVACLRDILAQEGNARRLRGEALLGWSNPLCRSPLLTFRGEDGVGSLGDEVADATAIARGYGYGVTSGSGGTVPAGYEHLEYSPLVNARAHVLGTKRRIVCGAADRQYRSLLSLLCYKAPKDITAADRLAVAYHLLLQDRVNEARTVFAAVPAPADSVAARSAPARGGAGAGAAIGAAVAVGGAGAAGPRGASHSASWMTLQYDYCAAYLDMFNWSAGAPAPATPAERFPVAAAVAAAYAAYPIPKWAAKFAELSSVLEESCVPAALAAAVGGAGSGVTSPGAADARSAATATIGSGVSADESGTSKEASRESQAAKAASREPQLHLRGIEDGVIVIAYANLTKGGAAGAAAAGAAAAAAAAGAGGDGGAVTVSLYRMDAELLFSTNPFDAAGERGDGSSGGGDGAASALGQFAFVRPNCSFRVSLPATGGVGRVAEARIPLPDEFKRVNAMVEVAAATAHSSIRRSQAWFANSLAVAVAEPFGRLAVRHSGTGAPLARVYVKVYWRATASAGPGAKATFLKDGYTAANGSFDYSSVSTDELSRAQRLAIYVASEKFGSVIMTAAPPKA